MRRPSSPLLKSALASACLAALLFAAPAARASGPEGRSFGLGLMMPAPTAITAKLWLDSSAALQLHLGFVGGPEIDLDYLLHAIHLVHTRGSVAVNFYMGGGVLIGTYHRGYYWWNGYYWDAGSGTSFGLRVPLGVALDFRSSPFEIFLELVPALRFVPGGLLGDFEGGVGIRAYF